MASIVKYLKMLFCMKELSNDEKKQKEEKEIIRRVWRLIFSEVFHLLFFALIVWKMTSEFKRANVEIGDNVESVVGVVWAVIGGFTIFMSFFISSHNG